jgi:hypothetical protein
MNPPCFGLAGIALATPGIARIVDDRDASDTQSCRKYAVADQRFAAPCSDGSLA